MYFSVSLAGEARSNSVIYFHIPILTARDVSCGSCNSANSDVHTLLCNFSWSISTHV